MNTKKLTKLQRKVFSGFTSVVQTSNNVSSRGSDTLRRHVSSAMPAVASVAQRLPERIATNSALKEAFGWKFMQAGLGNGRGVRTPGQALKFYRSSIPAPIRNLGAEKWFLKGKDASHIKSVANAPYFAKDPANLIWEFRIFNKLRGSRNMTFLEQTAIRGVNTAHTAVIVSRSIAYSAGRASAFSVLFELPVGLMENGIYIYRGKKTKDQAARDVLRNAKDAAVSGALGGAVTTGAIAIGAGWVIASAAPVLVPFGLAVFGAGAAFRIGKAVFSSDLDLEYKVLEPRISSPDNMSDEPEHVSDEDDSSVTRKDATVSSVSNA